MDGTKKPLKPDVDSSAKPAAELDTKAKTTNQTNASFGP